MTTVVPALLAEVLAKQPIPQRSFPWTPSGWREEMHDLPDVLQALAALPERVDRATVRGVVLEHLDRGKVLSGFVCAMVWGYGETGYGPIRVRWVLTGVKAGAHHAPIRSDRVDLLTEAARVVRAEGPVAGFRYMNNSGRIKYLASAFFTKWLYFASALTGPDDPNAAPILDKQVAEWLHAHAGLTLDIGRTADYEVYLATLRDWGDAYGRAPVQVEKAIFGLATGRT